MSGSVLALRRNDDNVKQQIDRIMELNRIIFDIEPNSTLKYSNREHWLNLLRSGCIYYTQDSDTVTSFLFVHRKTFDPPVACEVLGQESLSES